MERLASAALPRTALTVQAAAAPTTAALGSRDRGGAAADGGADDEAGAFSFALPRTLFHHHTKARASNNWVVGPSR